MSCPERDQTLLWIYGEGSPEHALHVSTCACCTAILDQHEEVLGALGPTLPAVRNAPVRSRRYWPIWVVAAVAAAGLFWVSMPTPPPPTPVVVAVAPPIEVVLDADLDARLDALDFELAELDYELNTL